MKPRILITGSGGMLGIDLARELGKGYEVIGTDIVRNPKSVVHKFYKADVTSLRQMKAVVGKAMPDIVIHTAAWTDVDGCELRSKKAYRINTGGAKNAALACRSSGAGLVYISTDFVFDGRKKRPYRESDKTGPLNVYADSKLKGEFAVKKTLKRYLILRTGWLYGKHGRNFVDTIAATAGRDGLLRVVDDQVGSPTYTVDLAKAIRALLGRIGSKPDALSSKAFGTYHISNSGRVSWYEYAKTILRFSGIKAEVAPISSRELGRPARRPAMSVMDNSKFGKTAGYRMRGWKSALREYLN